MRRFPMHSKAPPPHSYFPDIHIRRRSSLYGSLQRAPERARPSADGTGPRQRGISILEQIVLLYLVPKDCSLCSFGLNKDVATGDMHKCMLPRSVFV